MSKAKINKAIRLLKNTDVRPFVSLTLLRYLLAQKKKKKKPE
jgi:hypothetical protein